MTGARLKALLRRYMEVLFAHSELARMAMSTPASGPHYLRLVDTILGLLAEGGVPDPTAAWAVDLLLLFATANAAEHSTWKDSQRAADDMASLTMAIKNVDARKHPHIARLGDALMSGGQRRVDWSLDLLINGILATPLPVTREVAR